MSAGRAFAFASDLVQAKQSGDAILSILGRVPKIDVWLSTGRPLPSGSVNGEVKFENVHFSYPSRPDMAVLKGISFVAAPGQFIALVGPSGSGKSTIVQLCRFAAALK